MCNFFLLIVGADVSAQNGSASNKKRLIKDDSKAEDRRSKRKTEPSHHSDQTGMSGSEYRRHSACLYARGFFCTEFQKLKPKKTQNQGNSSKLKAFFLQKLKDDVIPL